MPASRLSPATPLHGAEKIHPSLPIFAFAKGDQSIVYTPGHSAFVSANFLAALKGHWSQSAASSSTVMETAAHLESLAHAQVKAWNLLAESLFQPECLTLYPSLRCNSRCIYCYSRHAFASNPASSATLSLDLVRSAAERVAENCACKGLPFSLVLHGGGEPTQETALMREMVAITSQAAQAHGIAWQSYLATNGCMEDSQLRWCAANFSHIGLSCDGPPDIHDAQRPSLDGRLSSQCVARAAQVWRECGAYFSVRATIIPRHAHRQSEIASYICNILGAREIAFEPAYRPRPDQAAPFTVENAASFASAFLKARRLAQSLGATLNCSLVRPTELHGPFCNALRNVLQLTPDGGAAACFLCASAESHPSLLLAPGHNILAPDSSLRARTAALRRAAAQVPSRCQSCPNIYHCARECPDFCLLDGSLDAREPGFRCLVAQQVGQALIFEATAAAAQPAKTDVVSAASGTGASDLLAHLAECHFDTAPLLEGYMGAADLFSGERRSLPEPVWVRRKFEDGPTRACKKLEATRPSPDPLSVYLHIPFCDRRCGFCDCYSFPLRQHKRETESRFLSALEQELEAWARLPAVLGRPATTIHFGGGTPTTFSPDLLARIVDRLKTSLKLEGQPEWALESTSSPLTPDCLQHLRALGFTRLHLGIQTMEDPIRHRIGRLESAEFVASKITAALRAGFILSVDVIYGLPGQTVPSLLDSLAQLVGLGVHGVSLYQLQQGRRNRLFLEAAGGKARDPLLEYAMFAAAEHFLRSRGFAKNHFAHFARPEDENLYYRHAARGEDLLALGPIADGALGGYHYRHAGLQEYMRASAEPHPRLEGGMKEIASSPARRKARAHLMAGSISLRLLEQAAAAHLLPNWLDRKMLLPADDSGLYSLSANGSWFLNQLLAELEAVP